jgi:hypothetical protein
VGSFHGFTAAWVTPDKGGSGASTGRQQQQQQHSQSESRREGGHRWRLCRDSRQRGSHLFQEGGVGESVREVSTHMQQRQQRNKSESLERR